MASPEEVTVAILPRQDAEANGAGWLLPDGDVITCAHVVEGLTKVWIRTLGPDAATHEYYVHSASAATKRNPAGPFEGDLALLKRVDSRAGPIQARSYRARSPHYGERVLAFGFPSHYPAGLSGYGRLGTASSVGRYELLEPEQREHILVQGFSGAPVLSEERANVVGLFASTLSGTARGYLIPPRFIREWLDSIGEAKHVLARSGLFPQSAIGALRKTVFGENTPEVGFDVRVREVPDDLDASAALARFPERYDDRDMTPEAFVSTIDAGGTSALIRAGGGGGKSTFLVEVAAELEAAEIPYLWLDLKKLKSDSRGGGLTAILDGFGSEPDELMKRLCTPACEVAGWGQKLASLGLLVIIADGVNEVGQEAARLLEALEGHSRFRAETRLVATARTTTQLKPSEDRRTFVVTPLAETVLESATGRSVREWTPHLRALLSSPQMLGLAVATKSFGDVPRSDMFQRYFADSFEKAREARPGTWLADASDDYLTTLLARLSFDLLHNAGAALAVSEPNWIGHLSRAFDHPRTKRAAGTGSGDPLDDASMLTKELVEQGVLTRAEGEPEAVISFHHPLYQEWLAATYFVRLPQDSWTNAGFTAITLEDTSDDALRLAVEQLRGRDLSWFLVHIYDWRWQRVMALVADGIEGLAPELRDAFIGLNALRLLDPFAHTRTAVERPLRRLAEGGDEFAAILLSAAEPGTEANVFESLRARVAATDYASETLAPLSHWPKLFSVTSPAGLSALVGVVSSIPFIGWAASNIVRVLGMTAEAAQAAMLAHMASAASTWSVSAEEAFSAFAPEDIGVGVRWRIVHMLGRGVPPEALDTAVYHLLKVWRDACEHRDVRFGACRSLMETALAHPDQRTVIFREMREALVDWRQKAPRDRKSRDSAFKAAEQLWRAWEPAEGVLDAAELEEWKSDIRTVLAAARETATALGWRTEALDAAMKLLQEGQRK